MNRRGFLATLAGVLLGSKALGPFSIDTPTPELWKAAPSLPLRPRANGFVPLQMMVAETVRIVAQETEWLRLKRIYDDTGRHRRVGDTVQVRIPQPFMPLAGPDIDWGRSLMPIDRFRLVNILQLASVQIKFEPDEIRGRPLPEFSHIHVKPAALGLAEKVIQLIRRNGGAEYMVTTDLTMNIPDIPRAALVLGQNEELSLRGVHLPRYPGSDDHREIVQIDMLFGLG